MTAIIISASPPTWRPESGTWIFTHDAATVRGDGVEWTSLFGEPLRERNALISVRIAGTAGAAGISFGAFKDFIAPVDATTGERLLQFDLDGSAWAFRVDAVRQERVWWDGAVNTIDDLFAGPLALKARHADEVAFRDLTITPFEERPRITVIMTCYRFAQRLRVTLRNWCRQALPAGALEVIVVNPASPDGTHELVASMAGAYPEVRLCELAVDGRHARNKGFMVNRGVEASRGEWIWIADADCVYPTTAAAEVLARVDGSESLFYGERRHLARSATEALLVGREDAAIDFDALANRTAGTPDVYPWGYGQIMHRSLAERIRYREDVHNYSTSDGDFVEECRRLNVELRRLDGLTCLHMIHPFAWYGTERFL